MSIEKLAKKYHRMDTVQYVNADMDEETLPGAYGILKRDMYVEDNSSISAFGIDTVTEVSGSGGGKFFSSTGEVDVQIGISGTLGNSNWVSEKIEELGIESAATMKQTKKYTGSVTVTFHKQNAYIFTFSNYIVCRLTSTNQREVDLAIVDLHKALPSNDWRKEFVLVSASRIAESGLVLISKKSSASVTFNAEVTVSSEVNLTVGQNMEAGQISDAGIKIVGGINWSNDDVYTVPCDGCTPIVELRKLKGFGSGLRMERLSS